MNRLSMLGISHRSAPLSLLERAVVPPERRAALLATLRDTGCDEAVVLSTCSRIELYATAPSVGPHVLLAGLARHVEPSARELLAVSQTREGIAATEHLFRVASGLESRVLGEPEIAGQVRAAFRAAHAAGTVGPTLGELFPAALRCAARVQSRTPRGDLGPSLGHRAVDVGLAALGTVEDPVVVVVGSGRMAASAVERLGQQGGRPVVVARNEPAATRLVSPGQVRPLAALGAALGGADLLICATSAALPVVSAELVCRTMSARSRPLVVVDLSVPRNVDAAVARVPGVRLLDLEAMPDDTSPHPALAAAVVAGADVVGEALSRYTEGVAARRVGGTIAALRRQVEATCRAELDRVAGGTAPEARAVAAQALAGRLLHRPTIAVRRAAAAGDTAALSTLCDVFGLPRPADGAAT